MADIFVSYRRDDSQWPAGRINERLEAVFGAGRVFFDTVTIRPGEDFHQVLGNRVGSCRVLLAVIGPRWLDILEARLGEPNDFVRIEIAEGLDRQVRVIPVLIDGASPPLAARLPDDLKALARLNAVLVRADTFRSDLDRLIGFLREYLDDAPTEGAAPPPGPSSQVQREGRIKVDCPPALVHGAPDGWFKPGAGKTEWFQDMEHGPEMVVLPPGSFTMGSPLDELERLGREGPQHRVVIARLFAVGRFAVTFDEWKVAVADGGCNGYRPADQGWGRGRRPVINVSWEDAQAYVGWLSRKTGKSYRLLSEAEWEYGCRAGTVMPFWWGASITPAQANYNGKHTYKGGGNAGEFRQRTVAVNSFEPSPWGLYQMHGNVWEWCEDVWHDTYNGAPADGLAWIEGGDAGRRVLRGGSWYRRPKALRSANRGKDTPGLQFNDIGFRVGRTL